MGNVRQNLGERDLGNQFAVDDLQTAHSQRRNDEAFVHLGTDLVERNGS
jgi:hypothetical protein